MYKRTFIVVLLVLVTLAGCTHQNEIRSRIDYFSGVSIPDEATLVYNKIDHSFGAQGHGSQFTVFSFKEDPIDFFTSEYRYGGEHYWTSPEGEKHYRKIFSGTLNFLDGRMPQDQENQVDHLVQQREISSEFAPNWENEYTYFVSNLNMLIYFKDAKMLIYVYLGY